MERNKDWRFDLQVTEGDVGEALLEAIIGLSTIEVKTDYAVSDTGNIAIEHECRGRPSGIARTDATWWCEALAGSEFADDDGIPEVLVLIRTGRLRDIIARLRDDGELQEAPGGEDGASKMWLLRPKELIRPKAKIAIWKPPEVRRPSARAPAVGEVWCSVFSDGTEVCVLRVEDGWCAYAIGEGDETGLPIASFQQSHEFVR